MKTIVSTKAVPAPSIPKGDRNMESCSATSWQRTPKAHRTIHGQAMPCLMLVSVSDQHEAAQLNHVATKGTDRSTTGEGGSDLFLDCAAFIFSTMKKAPTYGKLHTLTAVQLFTACRREAPRPPHCLVTKLTNLEKNSSAWRARTGDPALGKQLPKRGAPPRQPRPRSMSELLAPTDSSVNPFTL